MSFTHEHALGRRTLIKSHKFQSFMDIQTTLEQGGQSSSFSYPCGGDNEECCIMYFLPSALWREISGSGGSFVVRKSSRGRAGRGCINSKRTKVIHKQRWRCKTSFPAMMVVFELEGRMDHISEGYQQS